MSDNCGKKKHSKAILVIIQYNCVQLPGKTKKQKRTTILYLECLLDEVYLKFSYKQTLEIGSKKDSLAPSPLNVKKIKKLSYAPSPFRHLSVINVKCFIL